MTRITWTNCADRMPPPIQIILKLDSGKRFNLCQGSDVKVYKTELCRKYGTGEMFYSEELYWTPYTDEAWSELNNEL